MGKLISMLGLVVGLGLPAAGHAGAPSCDVSTNASVRALYKKLTSEDLSTSHECIKISSKFAGLVRIGVFYTDDGCRWKQMIYDCELEPKNVPQRAMAKAGWTTGNAKVRQELALAWLDEFDGFDALSEEPKPWKKGAKTFHPPQSKPTANGGLELKFWERDRPGMRPVATYHLWSVQFAADGAKGTVHELDTFSVPLN